MADDKLSMIITIQAATHYSAIWLKFVPQGSDLVAECQLVLKNADGGQIVDQKRLSLGASPPALRDAIRQWAKNRLIALGEIS